MLGALIARPLPLACEREPLANHFGLSPTLPVYHPPRSKQPSVTWDILQN